MRAEAKQVDDELQVTYRLRARQLGQSTDEKLVAFVTRDYTRRVGLWRAKHKVPQPDEHGKMLERMVRSLKSLKVHATMYHSGGGVMVIAVYDNAEDDQYEYRAFVGLDGDQWGMDLYNEGVHVGSMMFGPDLGNAAKLVAWMMKRVNG